VVEVGDEAVTSCTVPPLPISNTATVVADAAAKYDTKYKEKKDLIVFYKYVYLMEKRLNEAQGMLKKRKFIVV
jgi:hypothetical protein